MALPVCADLRNQARTTHILRFVTLWRMQGEENTNSYVNRRESEKKKPLKKYTVNHMFACSPLTYQHDLDFEVSV